jgi:regulatory protein
MSSEPDLESKPEPDPDPALAVEHALALAYAHLNRRDRTVQEMQAHLLQRGIQDEVAGLAVAELREQGYLDDGRFARLFIQDKSHLEHWGSDRIRQALLGRGITPSVADAALGESGGSSELERALALLQRRFPAGLPARRESERALGVLLRKGYEYQLACDALSEHRRRTGQAA